MVASRMEENLNRHQSVLLPEVLENLGIKSDGIYVDATFGRGGHSQAILSALGPNGRLLAMDKDPDAIRYAKQNFSHDTRFSIQQGSFAELEKFLVNKNVYGKVHGILFDLGVSSPQLDDASRGFSFMRSGPLDMRMDTTKGISAANWIATVSEKELATTLWEYGEEKFSRRIAKAIVTAREENPIVETKALADIISAAVPIREKGKHPATRSFQAIRIVINRELEDLKIGLDQSVGALEKSGRLLVISFHSLEDRIVKHFIQHHEHGDPLPRGLPVKQGSFIQKLKRLGKAIKPSLKEMALNPRSRSAILRIAEKLS